MKTIPTLTHITDVGAPSGDGSDSTERIRRQYQRLGVVNPHVVSAGQSPLHVAFTACTDVSEQAREHIKFVLSELDKPSGFFGHLFSKKSKKSQPLPVALNSAPRNAQTQKEASEDGYIYQVSYPERDDLEDFLVYGDEVVSWILAFRGRIGAQIQAIKTVLIGGHSGHLIDTKNGSQFRSAEHLPLIHYLESIGELNTVSSTSTESIHPDTFSNLFPGSQEVIVAPPDEYGNGRLIASTDLINKIFCGSYKTLINGITEGKIPTRHSLTEVIPDELSVWRSSNHFPAKSDNYTDWINTLGVLNLGTRWAPDKTRITDNKITDLLQRLSENVGARHQVLLHRSLT